MEGPGRDLRARAQQFGDRAAKLLAQLTDIGNDRIAEMDWRRYRCAGVIADFYRQRTTRSIAQVFNPAAKRLKTIAQGFSPGLIAVGKAP